jgi:hypothetical protein
MVALVFVWVCTPAIACLISPRNLTPVEMACCRQMKGDCGGMATKKHSCCPPVSPSLQNDKKVVSVVERFAPPAPIFQSASPTVVPQLLTILDYHISPSTSAESPPSAPLSLRI